MTSVQTPKFSFVDTTVQRQLREVGVSPMGLRVVWETPSELNEHARPAIRYVFDLTGEPASRNCEVTLELAHPLVDFSGIVSELVIGQTEAVATFYLTWHTYNALRGTGHLNSLLPVRIKRYDS